VIHPLGVGSAERFFLSRPASYLIPLLNVVQGRDGMSRRMSFIHLYS
jgi:hypothetical protein